MSVTKAKLEAGRWLATARQDLDAARSLLETGHYAHACFLSQQCAEKAVKAVWYLLDEDPWGHSVQKLLLEMPVAEVRDELEEALESAARLDRYYIPTRYPNGLPDLTPGQAYFRSDAEDALRRAEQILTACSVQVEE